MALRTTGDSEQRAAEQQVADATTSGVIPLALGPRRPPRGRSTAGAQPGKAQYTLTPKVLSTSVIGCTKDDPPLAQLPMPPIPRPTAMPPAK